MARNRLFRSLIYSTTAFQDTHKHTDRAKSRRTMYQTVSSPLFDIPDFPTLRRVKPLPKRRRTSLNIDPEVNPGINPALLPQSNSDSAYISTYHANPVQRNVARTSGVLSPVIDAQRSQYDWRLTPDLFLPEEILRVASALPERSSIPGIDDGGGGGGGDNNGDTGEPFLPPERKTPPLITSETHPMTATPPPPSDTSSYDGESPQPAQTPYRPPYYRSTKHLIRERLNLDEQFDPEVTEGELQDRFFLRTETDRLLAHADSLSAKMALRSYYHSMGYGTPELGTSAGASPVPLAPVPSPGVDRPAVDYVATPPNGTVSLDGSVDVNGTTSAVTHSGSGYVAVGVGRGHDEADGNGRGGDYTDHSSQQGQGNTKKRKVPANVGSSPPHHHHHHHHHYSSHRGTVGTYGMSYGQTGDGAESDEKEFSFGLGFGLDLGAEAAVEDSSSGTTLGGAQSDVFGPLPAQSGTQLQMERARSPLLPLRQFHRKPKLSRATHAGLQRKELVRSRKKQLEAIMGDLPASDTLVLDHALSRAFPPLVSTFSSPDTSPSDSPITDSDNGQSRVGPTFVRTGGKSEENWDVGGGWDDGDGKEAKVRLSKRGRMRAGRVARMGLGRLGRHPDAAPFPTGEFTYSLASATTERLVAMQQEVAKLRSLFATELARQTAKATEVVAGTGKNSGGGGGGGGGGGTGKAGKRRAQQRAKTIMNAKSGEQPAEFMEVAQRRGDHSSQLRAPSPQVSQAQQSQGQSGTPKKGKKKKRSTMANASNPHHLRNYVPSRLPHAAGGGGSHGQGGNVNSLWPLALKFLGADLPPRRRKDMNEGNRLSIQPLSQLVIPQEEWICSFCEYSLFYGDEGEYRRAIRNRKKILKRRRRARERAAAAASGVNAAMRGAAAVEKTQLEDEEYDESVPSASAGFGTGRVRDVDEEPPG